jgi:hypothetical protein
LTQLSYIRKFRPKRFPQNRLHQIENFWLTLSTLLGRHEKALKIATVVILVALYNCYFFGAVAYYIQYKVGMEGLRLSKEVLRIKKPPQPTPLSLSDFSRYNIPKRGKMNKKYTKWPQINA